MNYQGIAKKTQKIIQENGTMCRLRISAETPEYNEETNEYSAPCEVFDGHCVVSDYKIGLIDGRLIQAEDKNLLCVFPAAPLPGASVVEVFDKQGNVAGRYEVVTSSTICPDATTTIVYDIQGRK
jgi:hypothetical protein